MGRRHRKDSVRFPHDGPGIELSEEFARGGAPGAVYLSDTVGSACELIHDFAPSCRWATRKTPSLRIPTERRKGQRFLARWLPNLLALATTS